MDHLYPLGKMVPAVSGIVAPAGRLEVRDGIGISVLKAEVKTREGRSWPAVHLDGVRAGCQSMLVVFVENLT